MAQRTTAIASPLLHARPAAVLAKAAADSGHGITLTAKGTTVDATSLVSVLSLAISHSDEVIIDVDGADEERVADEMAALLSAEPDAA